MATPSRRPPLHLLFVNLLAAVVVAVALYLTFALLNRYLLHVVNPTEILLIEAGAIILIAWVVARAVTAATNEVMARRGGPSRAHAVRLFFNLLIAIGAVLALFKLAGVSLESIFLGSALAGIVLGLAAQTVLANVFAGILLVISDPFRPGDHVTFVSSSYGAIWPGYPHEMMYPGYSGVVEDVGLIYTVLRVEAGGIAKVPNSVVLGALLLTPTPGTPRAQRIRMTFPLTVSVPVVEAVLSDFTTSLATEVPGAPAPRLEVADISAATWDAVVTVWTKSLDESATRSTVLRAVLLRHPGMRS